MIAERSGRATIAGYFLGTYVVSWTLWAAAAAIAGSTESAPFGIVSGPIFLIGVFGPSLVAIALTNYSGGRAAVALLLSQVFRLSVAARWYLFAAGYMMTIKLTAAVLYRLTSGTWPPFGEEPLYLMAFAIIISTPVQAGEEIGWRGYALPRLAERLGLGAASIVLGALWACWHLPIFFMRGTDSYGQSFPMYFFSVIAISVAMAWLYWRTNGSLLLTMLMHAAINNTKDIVPSAAVAASSPFGFNASAIGVLTILLLWIGAVYFLLRMRCSPSTR